jgi:F0F1-type ATP synthase assembly protein I
MSPTTPQPADRAAQDAAAEGRQTETQMWTIMGHLIAAMGVYGGLGYLLGRWTGHPILLLFGALFGMVVSLAYTIHTANKAAGDN